MYSQCLFVITYHVLVNTDYHYPRRRQSSVEYISFSAVCQVVCVYVCEHFTEKKRLKILRSDVVGRYYLVSFHFVG